MTLSDAARSMVVRPGQSAVARDTLEEVSTYSSQMILIGPEGDFSPKEIEHALQQGFLPVTLGATRLRTETAGIVAATLLCMG